MAGTNRLEQTQRLMALKFPGLSTIKDRLGREVLPLNPNNARVLAAKEYLTKLNALDDDEFQKFVGSETELLNAESRRKYEEEEAKRFYNAPGSKAAIDHWAKAAYWTLDEAVALSFGREPKIVSWERLKPLLQVSFFAQQFSDVRDLAYRAKGMEQLYDPVVPGIFIAWAKRFSIAIPTELEAKVVHYGSFIGDWKTMYDQQQETHSKIVADLSSLIESQKVRFGEQVASIQAEAEKLATKQRTTIEELASQLKVERAKVPAHEEKPVGERERESLLKLLIVMAMGGYGHNPKDTRSTTVSEISKDFAKFGLTMDEDTIRKYLKSARETLPPSETEQVGH